MYSMFEENNKFFPLTNLYKYLYNDISKIKAIINNSSKHS